MFAVRSLTECAFADPAKLALDFDPHFRKFHFPDIRDRKESLNHIKRKLRQRKQFVPGKLDQFPIQHFLLLESDQKIPGLCPVVTFAARQSAVGHRPIFPLVLR